jgi:hypothetical protein
MYINTELLMSCYSLLITLGSLNCFIAVMEIQCRANTVMSNTVKPQPVSSDGFRKHIPVHVELILICQAL